MLLWDRTRAYREVRSGTVHGANAFVCYTNCCLLTRATEKRFSFLSRWWIPASRSGLCILSPYSIRSLTWCLSDRTT